MASTVVKQLHRRVAAAPHELQLARRIFSTATRSSNSSAATQHSPAAEGTSAGEGGAKPVGSENAGPPPHARTIRGSPDLGQAWDCWCAPELVTDRKGNALKLSNKHLQLPRPGRVFEKATGGPFKLLNQEGKVVTERDFVGNWTVVYFGFTFCPDMSGRAHKIGEDCRQCGKQIGVKLVPLFISVHPERDTMKQVPKDYHPRLVGLTGSVNEIRQVARQYRVYYMKTDEEDSDYLVDHSIILYLMDPNMEFVKFYGKNFDTDALTTGIIEEIQYPKSDAPYCSERQ